MPGPTLTAVDVWMDRGVGIVEPLATLYAYDARTFKDALREAIRMTEVPAVIVTLEAAVLVDVDVLTVIQSESFDYSTRGGRIVLVSVSAPTRRMLEICGMGNLIGSYESLEDALTELSER